jgi:uncharacterized membrane protein YphA (DoxX/SURF4 family)
MGTTGYYILKTNNQSNMNKKKTNTLYWIFNGIFAFFMLGSAIPDIISVDMAVEGFAKIGLPAYLLPFVGIAKTLGVIAILVPGYPRIKEWAYAGLMYDLIGAIYCIKASGAPASDWAGVLIPILFGILAYIFYHKRLKVLHSNINLQNT